MIRSFLIVFLNVSLYMLYKIEEIIDEMIRRNSMNNIILKEIYRLSKKPLK